MAESEATFTVYTLWEGMVIDGVDADDIESRLSPAPDPSDMIPLFEKACEKARVSSSNWAGEHTVHLYEPGTGVIHLQAAFVNGERIS